MILTVDSRQKGIVWVGVLLFVATGLYPPWIQVSRGSRGWEQRRSAYGWIFAPPVVMTRPEVATLTLSFGQPPQAATGPQGTAVESRPPINQGLSSRPIPFVDPRAARPPAPDSLWYTELDLTRLILQWVMLIVLAGACYLAWPDAAIHRLTHAVGFVAGVWREVWVRLLGD